MPIKSFTHSLVLAFVVGISTLLPLQHAHAEPYNPPMVVESSRHTFNLERSGRYTQTVEKTTRITNEYGVDNYGRHIFETNPSKETLKIQDATASLPKVKKFYSPKTGSANNIPSLMTIKLSTTLKKS